MQISPKYQSLTPKPIELTESNLKHTMTKFEGYPIDNKTVNKMQTALYDTYNKNATVIKYENGISVCIDGIHISYFA